MKFCYQCGKVTAGEPLFCRNCGRTYDVRLCPRLHPNPRYAKVCSQCGARELSDPQPQVSIWWKVLEFLTKLVIGTALICLSLACLLALLERPETRNAMFALGILLGLLWWFWSQLPEWFQRLVRRVLRRKESNREHR